MNDTAASTAKPKKSAARAEYSSPAVDKAVDIIEFLASMEESVSITAIAEWSRDLESRGILLVPASALMK